MTIISDQQDSRKFICVVPPLPGDRIISVIEPNGKSYYRPLSTTEDEVRLFVHKLKNMEPCHTIKIVPLSIEGFITLTRNPSYREFVKIVHSFDNDDLLEDCLSARWKAVQESMSA